MPTYLVSGQVASRAGGRDGTPDEYSMDLDFDEGRDPDVVHTSKVMLVTAKLLDGASSAFLSATRPEMILRRHDITILVHSLCAYIQSVTFGAQSTHILFSLCVLAISWW